MYKKVYVEITNNCNLKCDFCIQNSRVKKFMSTEEFKIILNKLKSHTKYLYFHVLGEPLVHPNVSEFIDYASDNYAVNITTNGYLINRIKDKKNIRQVNISLHSYDEKYNISLENYMKNIFDSIELLKEYTYISLRFWVKNKFSKKILSLISKRYHLDLDINNLKDNTKLEKNVYLSTNEEFIWPDLKNNYWDEVGSCYGLKHHIGILVDGTIIPCCLDSKGTINLGNIFKNDIDDIISSSRYQKMLEGFKNNFKVELLCKKCPIKKGIKSKQTNKN
ncbi:MAG: radical SAM protein [Firmicutes bacterium]|nr:radical SAM protein [Bacillota bacterium]